MAELQQCEFFLLQYVPNIVKGEFINIGVVLLHPGLGSTSGSMLADVRFTRDWQRVHSLDPDADLDLLAALESEVRARLTTAGDRDKFLQLMNESFSGAIQLSEVKGCLTESPQREIDNLAALYL